VRVPSSEAIIEAGFIQLQLALKIGDLSICKTASR